MAGREEIEKNVEMQMMQAMMTGRREWEVVNDDGFVYKRLKRTVSPVSEVSDGGDEVKRIDPTVFQSEDEKQALVTETGVDVAAILARQKRIQAILEEKERYEATMEEWEELLRKKKLELVQIKSSAESTYTTRERAKTHSNSLERHRQELSFQLEFHEDLIDRIKEIQCQGECYATLLEQDIRKDIFSLPVWDTPRGLIHALTQGRPK